VACYFILLQVSGDGNDVIPVAESVRVLGAVITPDLWLDKHVTAVNALAVFSRNAPYKLTFFYFSAKCFVSSYGSFVEFVARSITPQ